MFSFSFVKQKPTNITNMSAPKLISNVILICALVCVFGQDLEHYISLLCCWFALTLVRAERGVKGKDSKLGKWQHSKQISTLPLGEIEVPNPGFLRPELQTSVEGVIVPSSLLLDPISDTSSFAFPLLLTLCCHFLLCEVTLRFVTPQGSNLSFSLVCTLLRTFMACYKQESCQELQEGKH